MMNDRRCAACGEPINLARADAKTCSARCRKRLSRSPFPVAMTSRNRWMRRRADKAPLTVDGCFASSTDPGTWSSFKAARESKAGVGLGFALGDGIGCFDLDHCIVNGVLEPWAREIIEREQHRTIFAEVSQSGAGVHIFVISDEGPGSRRGNIEFYSRARYIAVTGNRL